MDADSDRCALELSDARVDVLGYACLVAIMATGPGYHCSAKDRLERVTASNGASAPVVTSAGALIDGLHHLGAKRIGLIAPYMKPLTEVVVAYIEAEGVTVARLPRARNRRQPRCRRAGPPGTCGAREAHRHQRRRCDRPVCMRADAVARGDTDRGGCPGRAGHQLGGGDRVADAQGARLGTHRARRRRAAVGHSLGPAVIRRDHFSKEMGSLRWIFVHVITSKDLVARYESRCQRRCSVALDVLSNVRPGCMCAFLLRGPQPSNG